MFTDNIVLTAWLEEHADPVLSEQLSQLDSSELDQLREVYSRYGDQGSNISVQQLSQILGQGTARFAQAAKKMSVLHESQRRSFVINHVIALFRLIDRGLDGTANNFKGRAGPGLPIVIEPAQAEAAFVRPLAEQAYDKVKSVLG